MAGKSTEGIGEGLWQRIGTADQGTHARDLERGTVPMTAAETRAHLKELASDYATKLRLHGKGDEVRDAWARYCQAVDNAVGGE